MLGILPFMLLDYFLVGWMDEQLEFEVEGPPFRYLWNYTMLVFFQGPAATILGVAYLGGAVFRHDKKSVGSGARCDGVLPGFFLCQIFLRGTLLATVLPPVLYR